MDQKKIEWGGRRTAPLVPERLQNGKSLAGRVGHRGGVLRKRSNVGRGQMSEWDTVLHILRWQTNGGKSILNTIQGLFLDSVLLIQ